MDRKGELYEYELRIKAGTNKDTDKLEDKVYRYLKKINKRFCFNMDKDSRGQIYAAIPLPLNKTAHQIEEELKEKGLKNKMYVKKIKLR